MKYVLRFTLLICFTSLIAFAKDDKSEKKMKAAIDKEELRFRKDVANNPNDAELYWDHANALAAFNSEYERAKPFYNKALEIDSTNASIYKDYGGYLYSRLRAFDDAKNILTKGLSYNASDEEIKKYLTTVNEAIAKRDEEARLRDFGKTDAKELNPVGTYSALANFDSLKKILADEGSDKNYRKLLKRYLADENLAPADMYLLMIGYSAEGDYNPFNYNDILGMKQLAAYNVDSAINKGIELISTNPLNPSLNRELMYYYRLKKDTVTANKFRSRIHEFFDGMLYSGNGSCDRPYLALWSKEYGNFASYLGYKPTENHSMGTCAGQMAEFAEMINPVTGKTESICFNLKLVYLQTTRR